MAWHSAGTTHFWCAKCKKQMPAESELVFKEGKVLWKWKCSSCGTDYATEA
jgi:DNA-directed RNA polymerase subunit RPC12/RpoP